MWRHGGAWYARFSADHSPVSILIALLALALHGPVQLPCDAPPSESCAVAWLRDFDAALTVAGETGKPVLVFFEGNPKIMGWCA